MRSFAEHMTLKSWALVLSVLFFCIPQNVLHHIMILGKGEPVWLSQILQLPTYHTHARAHTHTHTHTPHTRQMDFSCVNTMLCQESGSGPVLKQPPAL
jgi:hypothetical protein